ncbi:MAG: histidine--tRNA ligase [Erysipelotrichales bacterium]|nr:histidine--tRNA ligase [Erysipelotrichales bacterium]
MNINIVKGTHDIFDDDARAFEYIEMVLKAVAEMYSFQQMRTPILEHTELFTRSVGESSDIVRKEMYTFLDKGDRSVTLRPELTAGVMRSIVTNKLYATKDLPIKAYYVGPAFRYERPQAGRFRQFNQFGIESVGVSSPYHDLECIMMGYDALRLLGFKNINLKINSLGDQESRNRYREALKEYFAKHIDDMCADCKERFNINPLRILDCKVPNDQKIAEGAPKMQDYLTPEAKARFEIITKTLDEYEIPYEIDNSLVRGLDYYSHIIFEFHYTTANGLNVGAVGAGGHYDNLLSEVGGPSLSGVGLALGIERLFAVMKDDNLLKNEKLDTDLYVMPIGEDSIKDAFGIAQILRANAYKVEICLENKSFKQLFKRAENMNAKLAVIVGENEIKNNEVVLKDLHTQKQVTIPLSNLLNTLDLMFMEGEEEHHHCDCGCEDEHHHHEEE